MKEKKLIYARKSEDYYRAVKENGEKIGMRLNSNNTQLLCVSNVKHSEIRSYIRPDKKNKIVSGDSLKVLGFMFGTRPDTHKNTQFICRKFYGKLWTLRHLKRSGTARPTLLRIYESYLRPTIEYSSVVYGPLLTKNEAEKLEKLQKLVLRIIYGFSLSYDKLLSISRLETLKERRSSAIKSFACKTLKNARFCNKWFEINDGLNLRYREKYKIWKCNTERLKNGP